MSPHTQLAQKTIETFVREGKMIDLPDDVPAELLEKHAGVFVTIYKHSDLRGCIGTIEPVQDNIALEIINNAISSCSRDYRFNPVQEDELDDLKYEVSVLHEPIPVEDIEKHDPKTHGIIVSTSDGRKGLLLPDLNGIDRTEQQINIAAQKGMIDPSSDELILEEFEVEKFE
jgi:AmmeMemoRadiSam system protein A